MLRRGIFSRIQWRFNRAAALGGWLFIQKPGDSSFSSMTFLLRDPAFFKISWVFSEKHNNLPRLNATEDFMATGTVKWFNATKGFGFIQPDDGGQDVFVHISAVEQAGMRGLNEGQKIQYELIEDKRKGKTSAGNLKAV
jgi:CspA family cold shock protein